MESSEIIEQIDGKYLIKEKIGSGIEANVFLVSKKDTDEEYCIVMVPFKPTNDMDEKFCYRNGPYLGVLEKPPHEDTLYGVHIPDNMYFMFHFNIFTRKEIKNV